MAGTGTIGTTRPIIDFHLVSRSKTSHADREFMTLLHLPLPILSRRPPASEWPDDADADAYWAQKPTLVAGYTQHLPLHRSRVDYGYD